MSDSVLRNGADENDITGTEIQQAHRILVHYDVKMLHFAALRYRKRKGYDR